MSLRKARIAVLGVALLALSPAVASAAHWPLFGAAPGRSGSQVEQGGVPPLTLQYQLTDAGVRTSVIDTGAGSLAGERMAYGTSDGRIHLRSLINGAAVGAAGGIDVSDDADAFSGSGGSVSFASSSPEGARGQLFAVYNDDRAGAGEDISLAQVDEESGALVQEVPVTGTDGYTISSSLLISPASGADRTLYFIAASATDVRLFRVPVTGATTTSAAIGTVTSRVVPSGNPLSSPALVALQDAAGQPQTWVMLASGDVLRSYRADDLTVAGPVSPSLGGAAQTPSVTSTPPTRILAAAAVGGSTIAYQLTQNGAAQTLTVAAQSGQLAGNPAPALAVDSTASKLAYVTTSAAVYELQISNPGTNQPTMSERGHRAGSYGHVTMAMTRGTAYGANDGGDIGFGPSPTLLHPSGNAGATASWGQPAISRSFVQFSTDRGVFVYSTKCGNSLTGTTGSDVLIGTIGGDIFDGKGGSDRIDGLSAGDCLSASPSAGASPARATLSGGSGGDTITGNGVTASGGPGKDEINGDAEREFMSGDQGNDRLNGNPENPQGARNSDVIDGGLGNDTITGSINNDSLNGGPDDDTILGQDGNDGITGASGRDTLRGNKGADRISGGLGSDRLYGGRGGDNIVAIDGQADYVNCGPGFDVVRADGGDHIRGNCEKVIRRAGSFNKKLKGKEPAVDLSGIGSPPFIAGDGSPGQVLTGGAGKDTIDASGAGDQLLGLGGNDLLAGGTAAQILNGADGTDVISGGPGDDQLTGGGARDYMEGGPDADRIDGGDGSDLINGSQGDDVIHGGARVDSLNGGSDEDKIFGDAGDDGITGASGRDHLHGGAGDDRIEGGLGRDRIYGNGGNDNIVSADGQRDVIHCGPGQDTVRADREDRVARDCELVIERRGDRYKVVRR